MTVWVFSSVYRDSLVVLDKLFDQRSGRILMMDDVVERLNNVFVMVSETMRVGVR
jgi:hypothetical protein